MNFVKKIKNAYFSPWHKYFNYVYFSGIGAVATLLGLVAKEEVVGTFGTLSSMANSELATQGGSAILQVIATEFFGGVGLAGISFMIFNLQCAPCFAAMGAIKREMNNWKWSLFEILYMCVFAYAVCLIIYQYGALFYGLGNVWGTVFASLVLAFMLFTIFRPVKIKKKVK